MKADIDKSTRTRAYGWWIVLALIILSPIIQIPFVMCACAFGSAKASALAYADLAIGIRTVIALLKRDRSNNWILYLILYFALIYITPLIAHLYGGH